MAAAPVLTASFEDSVPPPSKRIRRGSGEDGGRSQIMGEEDLSDCSSATSICPVSFRRNLEFLRSLYPSVSEGLLSSLLESTGNGLEPARCLLTQILATSTASRPRANVLKRRRSSTDGADPSISAPMPAAPPVIVDAVDPAGQWVIGMIRRLQGVQSPEEAYLRIRPAVDELVAATAKRKQPGILPASMQKLMSKAIVQQAEKISVLKGTVESRDVQLDRMQQRIYALEERCQTLESANCRLKETNGTLSYYIRAALANNNCAAFFSGGSGPGTGPGGSGSFIPDVY